VTPARALRLRRAAVLAALVAAWELLPVLRVVDSVFVPPLHVVAGTLLDLARDGSLLVHVRLSAFRALGGFLLGAALGTPLGLLLGGWFPRLRDALEPLLELFAQANPVVLFHVVVLFLGIGEPPKLFVIGWLCAWSSAFGAMASVRAVDPELFRLGRAFGLSRLGLFRRVVLPAAAPGLFTGYRLSAGYAYVMLVAAEMMGASSGLGWFVAQAQESYHAPRIFAGAVAICALALATDGVLKRLEARVVDWQPPPDERRLLLAEGALSQPG
jgi:NitT/TauT family transport system permease protein